MTYEELKIQLDLNEPINILKSIGRKTKDNKWFVVCDNGDCHLFGNNGNEIDIKKIKSLYEKIIPKDIKKIIVPDSVIKIEHYTFCTCKNLKSIVIPNSVKSIEYCTFAHCENLTSINIPDSIKSIASDAFFGCESLASINIPDSTKYIGDATFIYCENLTSISIPDSIEHIGYDTFYDCKNLKSLMFKGKIINQVKSMEHYPFGIKDESIIKCIS